MKVEKVQRLDRYNICSNSDDKKKLTHDEVTKLLTDKNNMLVCPFQLETFFKHVYDSHLCERAVAIDGQQVENEEESRQNFDMDLLHDMLDVGLCETKLTSFGWIQRNVRGMRNSISTNLTIAIESSVSRYMGITPEDNDDMVESTTTTVGGDVVGLPIEFVCEPDLKDFFKARLKKCGCRSVGGKLFDIFSATRLTESEKQKLKK